MEQNGFRADTWHPAQSNSMDDNPQTRRAEGESLGGDNQGRQQPQHSGDGQQRKQQDPERARWHGKSLSSGELAKVYGFTDLDGSQPDAWRYVTEVQDAGKPADVTGYR